MGIVKQIVANAAWGRTGGANVIINGQTGNLIHLTDSADAPLHSLVIHGRSWQDASPTANAPQEIHSIGENGLRIVAANGNLADLSDRVNAYVLETAALGEAPQLFASSATNLFRACAYVTAGQAYAIRYTRGASPVSTNGRMGLITNDAGEVVQRGIPTWYSTAESLTFTPVENGWLWVAVDVNSTVVSVQPAGDASPWEEHRATEAVLTGLEPLRGIESEGETIADTLTIHGDGTGQIIRRIGVIGAYAGEPITGLWTSSTGSLTSGATVLCAIAPTVEELSAAHIHQLMALRTCKPCTNLSATDAPLMDLCYTADLKTYVDSKLTTVTGRVANLETAALN